jgi:hypothetical protein
VRRDSLATSHAGADPGSATALDAVENLAARLRALRDEVDRLGRAIDALLAREEVRVDAPRRSMTVPRGPRIFADPERGVFALDAEPPLRLASRHALRRVLLALVEAQAADRGRELSWERLLAAGWPDERVLARAGHARVRSALATLRRLGLRDVIVTGERGYALAPGVSVAWKHDVELHQLSRARHGRACETTSPTDQETS